jgi:hypothetical protein
VCYNFYVRNVNNCTLLVSAYNITKVKVLVFFCPLLMKTVLHDHILNTIMTLGFIFYETGRLKVSVIHAYFVTG